MDDRLRPGTLRALGRLALVRAKARAKGSASTSRRVAAVAARTASSPTIPLGLRLAVLRDSPRRTSSPARSGSERSAGTGLAALVASEPAAGMFMIRAAQIGELLRRVARISRPSLGSVRGVRADSVVAALARHARRLVANRHSARRAVPNELTARRATNRFDVLSDVSFGKFFKILRDVTSLRFRFTLWF